MPTMIDLTPNNVEDQPYKDFVRNNALVVTQEAVDDPDDGKILYQRTAPATTFHHGDALVIGVARPNEYVEVPNFVGMDNSSKWIKNWELQARVKVHPRMVPHLRQDPGIIFGQSAGPGTRIKRGETITVSVVMDRPQVFRNESFGSKLKHPIRTIFGR